MITVHQREGIAFSFAPIPALVLLPFLEMWVGLVDYWHLNPLTVVIAYVLELMLGFPLHLQLQARGLTGSWDYLLAGAAAAILIALLFLPLHWSYSLLWARAWVPSGVLWGATFWSIAVRRKP